MHIQLTSATATAPGAGGAAAAAVTGDSLTVLNANRNKRVDIIALWGTNQTAGFAQVAFPTGHDTTRGYRASVAAAVVPFLLPLGLLLPITPQEAIAATIAGSATAGDVEQLTFLTRYEDMPGITQRLIGPAEVERRTQRLTTIEASLVSSAGPGYSGTAAINAGSDLLIANRDYAVVGFSSRTAVQTIGIVGPDTGNVRVGCPGVLRSEITAQWFKLLSVALGEPLIPVINSGNRSQTNFFVATDENAGTFLITAYLVLLS